MGFSTTQETANAPRIGRLAGTDLLRDELKARPIAVGIRHPDPWGGRRDGSLA